MVRPALCVRCGTRRTAARDGICIECKTQGDRVMAHAPSIAESLGQRTKWSRGQGLRISDANRPLTRAELDEQIRSAAHGGCVEHVRIEGLRNPVCIQRGQDREQIIADAMELTGHG